MEQKSLGWKVIQNDNDNGVKEYIVDTVADLSKLPKSIEVLLHFVLKPLTFMFLILRANELRLVRRANGFNYICSFTQGWWR